jgi:choline dehydrogenase-like flavoprotein
MFVDANDLNPGQRIEADVCVVGAGAAGISAALSLAARRLDVVLLESGGHELEEATQQLYAPASTGSTYPVPTCRLRYFGGTTNHWGGACRPLDPFDFESHEWVPESGWPLSRADLAPYYAAAAPVLDLSRREFAFDPAERGASGLAPLLGADARDFEPIIWRRTQPGALNFGAKYRPAIRDSSRIRCVLHANATELVPVESATAVQELRATTLGGAEFRVRARGFLLATGAIENARLLLDSDSRTPGGLGNANDTVGRYFADHGFRTIGWMLVTHPEAWLREERFMRDVPQSGFRIEDTGFASTPAYRTASRSLGFAMMAAPFDHNPKAPGANAIRELTVDRDRFPVRRPKGLGTPGDLRWIGLIGVAEQSPNPNSRITLQDERNAVGSRRAAIHHAVRAEDWKSLRESARRFGTAVAQSGHGRMKFADLEVGSWVEGVGGHHAGTTRMSDDPRRGVTDRQARVHGIANLFVAGSSLFPTSGHAHPTYTVVALALRAADRLAALARSGA